MLNSLEDDLENAIRSVTPCIYAGTFTHNFEQLHYFYVESPSGLLEKIEAVYREKRPGAKVYTNIKIDAEWSAYLTFLFPSEAIRDHYGLRI